ncbi:hypothetical protein ACHQM5_016439 [Ranunculus cassubicifolius]
MFDYQLILACLEEKSRPEVELCQNENCTVRVQEYGLIKKFSQRKVSQFEWICHMPNSELIKEDEAVELNEPIQTQEPPSFPAIRKRARICEREPDTYNVGPSQASSCVPDPGRIT